MLKKIIPVKLFIKTFRICLKFKYAKHHLATLDAGAFLTPWEQISQRPISASYVCGKNINSHTKAFIVNVIIL